MIETSEALRQMADHVAQQLVAEALERLTRPGAAVVVTVHAQPPRRAIGPAPKKPGRPKKRDRSWTPEQRENFTRTMAARRKATAKPAAKPARTSAAPATTSNACRRCDHDRSAHVGPNTKCLVPKCGCDSLYQ